MYGVQITETKKDEKNNETKTTYTKYYTIGNATNIVINTQRGKVPIFTFGSADPVQINRGQQFVTGQIDLVVLQKSFIFDIMAQKEHYITPVEQAAMGLQSGTDTIVNVFGSQVSAKKVSLTNIDDIKFDELLLVSADPQPADGGKINVMTIKLENIEIYDYSYAKTIDDVTSMERVTFMAQKMYPASVKQIDAAT